MSTKKLLKAFGLLLVVALLAAVLPMQAKAQTGGNKLYVADWSVPAATGVTGRETVLFDGTYYHMWYSPNDSTIYHTTSDNPASFTAATDPCTFTDGTPAGVDSVSVVKEGDFFYMIAYEKSTETDPNKKFAIYSSTDGIAWTYGSVVFDGTGISNLQKIDGPFLFKTESGFRLYFQVGTGVDYASRTYDIYVAESSTITGQYNLGTTNPVLTNGATGTWDANDVMHPWVVEDSGTYYMWYSGFGGTGNPQKVGMAKSADGYNWVKSPANPIFAPATGYAEPSVITDGDTWQMWTMGTGLVINYLTATGPFEFQTIQAAINAAVGGETILVAPGTYQENVVINTPNLTLQSSGTAEETIVSAPTGVGISVLKDLGTVTVDGFTVEGWTTAGISQSWKERAGTTFIVKNNIVNGTGDEVHGNCIQVTGDSSLVEGNAVDGAYYTGTGEYGASGILVYLANNAIVRNNVVTNADIGIAVAGGGAYGQSSMTGALVIDNEVSLSEIGIGVSFDANNTTIEDNFVHDNELGLLEEYNWGYGPTGTVALHNQVVDNIEQALTESYDGETPIPSGHIFMAEANWWGSIAGPGETEINEYVDYAPWCGDEICSFLVYPMVGTDLQASINATPTGGTLYVPDLGTDPDYTGSYTVGGKTLILGEGVTIQANSPCFTVTGNNTIITAETIGEAKCVLSDTYGIEVKAGLKNVVIEGIYFDADAAVGSADILSVINFNGAIEDVLINDNYFHYAGTSQIGTVLYDGIFFAQQPTGVVEIKGNLFEMSGISGCAVSNYYGTSTIDAQFNSFGSMAGHPASVPGERVCDHVDYGNYTHADVYLESSATPWLNQEVVGQKFTLIVKANLTKVTGAKFTLQYDPALVELDAASLANLSGFSAAGPNMFEVDENLGLITFNANAFPAITGEEYGLFSADFTASAVGSALFEVDALTDEFAMFPGYASSSNVYGYTLLPVTVDLIELPTVASTFGDSYYLVGEARDFTMTVTNFDTAYTAPELRITIPTGLTLKYNDTDYTGSLVVDLADLAVNEVVTIDLTATFTVPFNTAAAVLDVDLVDALTPEELLVETSFSAFAYTKPTVTIASDPYFLVEVPGDFSVTIDNPVTGRNYGDSIVFDIVIEDHLVADISAVSCTMGTQTWDLTGALTQEDVDVTARIGGVNGYFTVPADFNPVINCSITYATPGTYEVSGYMVEAIPSPERIVSNTYSATAQVYTQPVITSDNLDGPFQAGLAQDVTLTITNPDAIPEPFDLVFSLPEGSVILYNEVTYTCLSTGCPVIPLVTGAVPGDIDFTITFPVGFVGGTADISVSLYDRDTVGAPSPLATLDVDAVVVYANIAAVTGTVSMQGRTTRAGVLYTLAGNFGFGPYTATSINTLSNNVSFTNLASGLYAITVEQARYLDITITHGATIDLALSQAIANLMLRAGDATDDNYINGGDASIVGTQYGTGTIADQGDVNFDNKVNIQDLALVGGNFDLQSANSGAANYAYGTWMK